MVYYSYSRGKYFGIFSGCSSGKGLLFWTCLGKVCKKNRIFVLNFGSFVLNFGMSVHNFGMFALNPAGLKVLVILPAEYLPLYS